VYRVALAAIARIAASLICCGVSKSGSPAPSKIMGRPCRFNALSFAVICRISKTPMERNRRGETVTSEAARHEPASPEINSADPSRSICDKPFTATA
jgi:hypothetical protein